MDEITFGMYVLIVGVLLSGVVQPWYATVAGDATAAVMTLLSRKHQERGNRTGGIEPPLCASCLVKPVNIEMEV